MEKSGIEARLRLAEEVARQAGAKALSYFEDRAALVVETKGGAQDVFSIADRNVETLIRETVAARFPEDGFIGEEHAPLESRSGFTWVVDPIDGTSPFIFGLDDWCVSIAVHDGTRTVAGAIHAPRKDELYSAAAGGGATLNGETLRLKEQTLASGLTGVGANFRTPRPLILNFLEELMAHGGMFIRNGSGALMLAQVAAGKLAAYYEPHMNAWDCLAGLLIVEEAGGWAGKFPEDAELMKGGPVLAAAPGAANDLRAMVERSRAKSAPEPA
jgi:myo-inositol-1(or 4)-monophosphatase